MKISKDTLAILSNFSGINTNLVINPGKKFSTVSASKDIMAEYEGEDNFDKTVSIFNLNELLSVIGAFSDPEFVFDDKVMVVSEGKQKVQYVYADTSLLTVPTKGINMPAAEVSFALTGVQLARIQKMSGILSVEDLAFIGNGKKVVCRVFDAKNPTGNNFDIDLEVKTSDKFNIHFKVEKINKLYAGDYNVEVSSKKIAKFVHGALKLNVYIAVESDSVFE